MSITFLLFQFVNILDSEEAQFYVKNIVIYMGKMAVAAFQAKFQALIWKASSQLPLNSVLQVQSWKNCHWLGLFSDKPIGGNGDTAYDVMI